jgi:hypothetical protein
LKLWECCCKGVDSAKAMAWFAALAGALLLVGGLAWWVLQRTQPAGVDLARAELRAKNLAEIRAADHLALTTADVLDKTKGIYRIPITNAVELLLVLWQDPTAGRSNLLQRAAKATAKAPEKPSEYE